MATISAGPDAAETTAMTSRIARTDDELPPTPPDSPLPGDAEKQCEPTEGGGWTSSSKWNIAAVRMSAVHAFANGAPVAPPRRRSRAVSDGRETSGEAGAAVAAGSAPRGAKDRDDGVDSGDDIGDGQCLPEVVPGMPSVHVSLRRRAAVPVSGELPGLPPGAIITTDGVILRGQEGMHTIARYICFISLRVRLFVLYLFALRSYVYSSAMILFCGK